MLRKAILLVVGLAACGAAALIADGGPPRLSSQETRGTTLADLPEPERQSLGAAMHEARYRIWKADGAPARGQIAEGEVLTAASPSQGYDATFLEDGARVETCGDGGWSLGLTLAAFGGGGDARPVGRATRSAGGRRVEYGREGIVEWYENTDEGLEHGFTVAGPPGAGGEMEIVLEMDLLC